MTKAKFVFDPFSQDFFNGAYETYRRMRDEAPVYYNEEHDFYALTRHEDVAPAFKDFDTYLLDVRRRPLVGPKRCADNHGHEDDHLHGPSRAPQHAQPAQQGIHAAGHSGAVAPWSLPNRREISEPPRPERFRRRAGVLWRRSPSRSSPRCWVCQRIHASRSGIGSMKGCTARSGQVEVGEKANAGEHRLRRCSTSELVQKRRAQPARRPVHQAHRSRSRAGGWRLRQARRSGDRRFCKPSRRCGRRDGDQAGRQRRVPVR